MFSVSVGVRQPRSNLLVLCQAAQLALLHAREKHGQKTQDERAVEESPRGPMRLV
jgi:hypothetical protein